MTAKRGRGKWGILERAEAKARAVLSDHIDQRRILDISGRRVLMSESSEGKGKAKSGSLSPSHPAE